MPSISCRRLSKIIIISAVVAFVGLLGCGGSSSDCTLESQNSCVDSIDYWVDSCGNVGNVKQYCGCGCKDDQTGCADCPCSCSEVDTCCDGCRPTEEGRACNDNNPATLNDVCEHGSCSGWDPADIAEPALPALPALPEPVQLNSWTCPANWVAVEHESLLDADSNPFSWCQPPSLPRLKLGPYTTALRDGEQEGDREICEPEIDGTYPLLGHSTCQPLGVACPAGDWPDIPPELSGNRIFVKAGSPGGDGSQAAPYATISEAVASALAGELIVIARGTYPESISLDKDLTLYGACPSQTSIVGPGPYSASSGVIAVAADTQAAVYNLRISGGTNGVRLNGDSSAVLLAGVWIHESTGQGISGGGAEMILSGVLITSVFADSSGSKGVGVSAWGGPTVDMTDCTIENVRSLGILGGVAGTQLAIENVAIRATRIRQSDNGWGQAVRIMTGATATFTRGLLDGNLHSGLDVLQEGSRLDLSDILVRGTRKNAVDDPGEPSGWCLEAFLGAQLTMARVVCDDNRGLGVGLLDPGTQGELSDVVIKDTLSSDYDGTLGTGIEVVNGARLTLARVLLQNNSAAGLVASNLGVICELEDLVVLDTSPQESNGMFGRGLVVQAGAALRLTRGLFMNNHDISIAALNQGSSLVLSDISVHDTASQQSDLLLGRGLEANQGAYLSCSRGLFENNRSIGIAIADPGTVADLSDISVFDTQAEEATEANGRGLTVQSGAQATLMRGSFARNRESGLIIRGPGSSIEIEDLTVADTYSQIKDAEREGIDLFFGRGMEVSLEAAATLKRGQFLRNRDAGIVVILNSLVQLEDITIKDTTGREADLDYGVGLSLTQGSQVLLLRGLFENNKAAGIMAGFGNPILTLEDIIIRSTRSREMDLFFGAGLQASGAAQVSLRRGLLQGNHALGVCAFDPGTFVELHQISIQETNECECFDLPGPQGCPEIGFGMGLGTYSAAEIEFESVDILGSALAGVQLAFGGSISGQGLAVRNNPIGLNIQDTPEGYDFFEQVNGLWIEGSQVNYDATALEVPDAMEVLE
jgi:parallel beta helix pectate lyase-like protein